MVSRVFLLHLSPACDEPGPSGRYRAGIRCLRLLPMSPLLQEPNYRSDYPCLKSPFENSTKNQHWRWGEGSYGKSCFKAVSERGRCWQLILVRAEGGKKVWEVSQVLCGERHWRSSNPVALSPSRFTPRSQFEESRLERAVQSKTAKRR